MPDVPTEDGSLVTPEQIIDDLWAPRATQVLVTAVELDLFSRLADGAKSAAQVAAEAGAAPRPVRHLLDALVALGYPPVTATMSNAVGLVAGGVTATWGYRAELGGQEDRLRWQIPA